MDACQKKWKENVLCERKKRLARLFSVFFEVYDLLLKNDCSLVLRSAIKVQILRLFFWREKRERKKVINAEFRLKVQIDWMNEELKQINNFIWLTSFPCLNISHNFFLKRFVKFSGKTFNWKSLKRSESFSNVNPMKC